MSNPCDTGWCRPNECTDIDCKNGSDLVLKPASIPLKKKFKKEEKEVNYI